ncbi:hypothetical protein C1H46_005990 [Malus baccata]|uniref:Uncharacterized protein n=1 Tax=Malus baccata TaxID=106549 RepID=A0A540NBE5_MALBA|nr:hypothetical protein C1H46_005990 [Malus baccata]
MHIQKQKQRSRGRNRISFSSRSRSRGSCSSLSSRPIIAVALIRSCREGRVAVVGKDEVLYTLNNIQRRRWEGISFDGGDSEDFLPNGLAVVAGARVSFALPFR